MLDIELFAASGKLFDGKYKMIRPISNSGGTADVWLALDMNTVKDPDAVANLNGLSDAEIEQKGLIVAIKVYRPQNALDIEGEMRFRDEYMIVFNCHHTNLIHPTHFSIYQEEQKHLSWLQNSVMALTLKLHLPMLLSCVVFQITLK